MKMNKLLVALVALLLCVGITACSKKTVLTLDVTDNPSGVAVTTDSPGPKDGAISQGAIVVAEGEKIVVTPNFSKGSLALGITSESGSATIYDDEVEGVAHFSIDAAPGSYTVRVKGTNNGAVGTLTVCAQAAE